MEVAEIVARYAKGDSLKRIAVQADVCYTVIRRVLITEGVPLRDCPKADAIHAMLDRGMTIQEIAEKLKINRKTVESYTPYSKGSYSIGEKSINAQRIRKSRERSIRSKLG